MSATAQPDAPSQESDVPAIAVELLGNSGAVIAATQKKRRPPLPKPPQEQVLTVSERLKMLAEIPTLKTAPADVAAMPVLDPDAPPPPAPAPVEEPSGSTYVERGAAIPDEYGHDRIAVLPRDPYWVFVYWELGAATVQRLRAQHGEAMPGNPRWVLRVRTLHEPACGAAAQTSGGPYLVDVDVQATQWYLRVSPDTHLAVDLGFLSAQGEFVCVLQGNQARTPRAGTSEVVDERWMILRAELEQLLRASGAGSGAPAAGGAGSESMPRFLRSEQPRAVSLFSSYLAQMEKKK